MPPILLHADASPPTDPSVEPLVQLDRTELLRFFDTIPAGGPGHATALCSMAGEELGAGLLKHYRENFQAAKVAILPDLCTQGTQKGLGILVDRSSNPTYLLGSELAVPRSRWGIKLR